MRYEGYDTQCEFFRTSDITLPNFQLAIPDYTTSFVQTRG